MVMGSTWRKSAGSIAAVVTVIGLTACGQSSSDGGSASSGTSASTAAASGGTPLKVGISNPMSGAGGSYAALGQGMQAYLEYQNEQGGVAGHKLDVQMLDSGESSSGGATTVRKLLNDDPFMLGIVGSTPFQAASSVLKSQAPDVPVFSMGNAAVVKQANLPSAYGEYPDYTTECFYDAKYAIDNLKASKIAVVYEDDAVGQGAGKECPGFVTKSGATSVGAIAVPPTATDFGPIAAKIKSSGADTVLIYGLSSVVAGVQKAASAVGYEGNWVTFSSNFDDSYLKLAGPAAEGTYVDSWLEPVDADTPAAQLFREQIKKRAPNAQSSLGAAGWTMGAVAVHAMEQAVANGTELTTQSFTDALNQIDGESIGLAPSVSYAGDDHSTFVHSLAMYQVKDGKLVKVADPSPIPAP
jgi:branched-chain amino acid transport system substrate-binding protein